MRLVFYSDDKMLECFLDGRVKDIPASCIVRNEVNKWRKLHDPKQVVSAMTHDPYSRPPVMPRQFPRGTWAVYKPRSRPHNPYLAPYFIPTDAEQLLEVWDTDLDGGYSKATGKRVLDIGYGLHYSSSNTTVGCIRIHSEGDLLWLAQQITEEIERGHIISLSV